MNTKSFLMIMGNLRQWRTKVDKTRKSGATLSKWEQVGTSGKGEKE